MGKSRLVLRTAVQFCDISGNGKICVLWNELHNYELLVWFAIDDKLSLYMPSLTVFAYKIPMYLKCFNFLGLAKFTRRWKH